MKFNYFKGDNVVTLLQSRRERTFPAIAQIEAYWQALRNGRLMPARSEVNPRGISDQLSNAFILEQIAPGLARMRLAGQHLHDIMSMEVRGMPISAFFTAESRDEIQEVLANVFDTPAQVVLSLRIQGGAFQPARDAQMILLPLKDEKGRVTRALGGLQVSGTLGHGPHRLSIRSMEARPLLVDGAFNRQVEPPIDHSGASMHEDFSQDSGVNKVARIERWTKTPGNAGSRPASKGHVFREQPGEAMAGFAEGRAPFEQTGKKKSRHLRLVESD